jgi:glycine cleavage system H protein
VKAAAEVYLPVAGTVVAVNDALPQAPEQVNRDPYGAAWMVRIKIANPAELGDLLDAAAYEVYCQERAT